VRDLEIRRALVEADAGEFATKEEVKAMFDKWKLTSSNRG
jgi:predicted transcriptional regulator